VMNVLRARSHRTVEEWTSGRLDAALSMLAPPATREQLLADLLCLDQALQRFPTTNQLALHLRAGVDQVPEPLLELPPAPLPEEPPTDLLDQLLQNPRTAGLARLTQRLVAALHIPLHAHASSEQPLGGVADVTNRGNFDRLLLSELAHDDLALMARLVNNEALYLRREAPPTKDVRPHIILLDTTLRMWGVPRVFALAAALAWARHAQQPRHRSRVVAHALGGQDTASIDLESFDGVVEALSRLDVAPHAGASLQAFASSPATAGTDCLLITDAQLLVQPEFAAVLAQVRSTLRFLLTVDRSGELQLHELQHGHRTLISTTRFDLDQLLFAPAASPLVISPRHSPDEPAYLTQNPLPLYFPTTGMRPSEKTTFFVPQLGALGITNVQRVLFCPSKDQGATELLPFIESGQYHFGFDGVATVYVLVNNGSGKVVFYAFATDTNSVERVDLAEESHQSEPLTEVTYQSGCFFLRFGYNKGTEAMAVMALDCASALLRRHGGPFPEAVKNYVALNQVKRHINSGYNVLQRVEHLSITDEQTLLIDGNEVKLVSTLRPLTTELRLVKPGRAPRQPVHTTLTETIPLPANKRVYSRHFRWPNGSTTVADSRGLLHLRSANPDVPEITLLLILGQHASAAWASDGTVCGPAYFTGPDPFRRLPATEFYQQYIHRFITALAY